jgi:hypothetical protein
VGPTAPVTGAQGKTFSGHYSIFVTIRERRSRIFGLSCDLWWDLGPLLHSWIKKSKQAVQTHQFSTPPPQKSESNFFSGEDHDCCVLGFQGYHSPGLFHWSKDHQCAVLFNSPEWKSEVGNPLKAKKRQDSVCFLQDNVSPHTAAFTMATLLKLKWDVLPHPPYSQDLDPSDYHLFGPMKGFLGSKRFRNINEVIAAVQSWIHKQPHPSLKLESRSFQNVGTSVWQSTGTTLKSSM